MDAFHRVAVEYAGFVAGVLIGFEVAAFLLVR